MPTTMKGLKTDADNGSPLGVDRKAGVIRGVVLAEEGPFKSGRGEFDRQSIKQIVAIAGKERLGLKSRFTHPDLSSDGLGKFLGRVKNPRLGSVHKRHNGRTRSLSVARGDLHFAKSAFDTPSGNLASYVMDLAEEDSTALAMSVVLRADEQTQAHSDGQPKRSDDGEFLPPLWRPTELHAADVVDTGDATNSMLGKQLSEGGLPDVVVREASGLLRKQFASKSREYVEFQLSAWVDRVLDHYWPPQSKGNAAELRQRSNSQMRDVRRQIKVLEDANPRPFYHVGSYDTPNVTLRPPSHRGAVLEGYAAAWDQLSRPINGWREVVRRGAFASALSTHRIQLLVGHKRIIIDDGDHGLKVWEDAYGLRFSAQPALFDEPTWANVLPLITDGTIVGASLSIGDEQAVRHRYHGIREIVSVNRLEEISLVAHPAWPGTVVKAFDDFPLHRSRLQSGRMMRQVQTAAEGEDG